MSIKSESTEIAEIVKRTTDNLLAFTGKIGQPGAALRYACGDLVARAALYLADGTFANHFLTCFQLATQTGIDLNWMDRVLVQLTAEKPTTLTSSSVVQNALIFAIAQEGRIIGAIEFTSRDDVDLTMRRMNTWFETIKDIIADTMSGPGYQDFIALTAAITRHLTDTARPLPRMLRYDLSSVMPGLAISQFIYGDGTRSEELAAESKIVHPAFFQRTIRALSA